MMNGISDSDMLLIAPYHNIFSDADIEYRKHMRDLQSGFSLVMESTWDQPFVIDTSGQLVYLNGYQRQYLHRSYCHRCSISKIPHYHLVSHDIHHNSLLELVVILRIANHQNRIAIIPKILLNIIGSYLDKRVYCNIPNAGEHTDIKLIKMANDVERFRSNFLFKKYINMKKDKLPIAVFNKIVQIAKKERCSLTKFINYLESGKAVR